jgi:hypothetical protein
MHCDRSSAEIAAGNPSWPISPRKAPLSAALPTLAATPPPLLPPLTASPAAPPRRHPTRISPPT